ncbi:uncharacterized protein LOC132536378 [Erinaceus europaeus]|uniref:Uncharacterized protein LOC132536378 n=1 Tax=Erinaceus europaeus TaxID=9365 RepID=A0ABM3WU84_ERIEU|nr:uncharacterized protein LOC132536378 [Erinaceus europaeus]
MAFHHIKVNHVCCEYASVKNDKSELLRACVIANFQENTVTFWPPSHGDSEHMYVDATPLTSVQWLQDCSLHNSLLLQELFIEITLIIEKNYKLSLFLPKQDQFDNLEKHTQWGIDILEKYIKFVKERTEIELSYAKQLRNLSKKYQPKKNSKEEEEYRYTACKAFLSTLNEMNDYAGQHEVISENMTSHITVELARYVQELKQERKSVTKPWFFFPRTRNNENTP